MLHIIGMILKIIGMILAVILGILVLLICIALFVPLRYQADAEFNGTPDSIQANVKCSWLLHLISASVSFQNGELRWRARIVYKTFGSEMEAHEAEEVVKETAKLEADRAAEEESARKKQRPTEDSVQQAAEETKDTAPASEPAVVTVQEIEEKNTGSAEEPAEKIKAIPEKEKRRKRKNFFVRIAEKLKAFFANIKYTFKKICDKIKVLVEKKELVVEFIEDEVHKLAFKKLKKEAFRLLRFLKPKKFLLRTRFGFEDPYHTGQVLALLSVVYPFVGGHLTVEPDFEERVLEGDLFIKGKVRTMYAVIIAWNLFWDKNVRKLYADVKRMSGK